MRIRIAVTLGDPRGIGSEVAFRAIEQHAHAGTDVTFFGNEEARPQIPEGCGFESVGSFDGSEEGAGIVSAVAIERAVEGALAGEYRAVVTAPVSKLALHAGGRKVPGQTEMLQQLAGCGGVGMLMASETTRLGGPLRVLLATTHHALRDVPRLLTEALLTEQASLLNEALRRDWGIARPRIALCGLNPHASDGGLFGSEEAMIFEPAVRHSVKAGIDIQGPLPADTVFQRALAGRFDAVIACYHDQGLIPVKLVGFGETVNITLGLPIVRTSVDHGTAFDIAGRGVADETSLVHAVVLAAQLARGRSPHGPQAPVSEVAGTAPSVS